MKLQILIMVSLITGLVFPNKTVSEHYLIISSQMNFSSIKPQIQVAPPSFSFKQVSLPVIQKDHLKIMVIDTGVGQNETLNKFIQFNPGKNDLEGHGTHVAGIVAMGRLNGTTDDSQVDSVCGQVEIVSCRVNLKIDEETSMSSIADCVNEATAKKIDIINISAGGSNNSVEIFSAWKDFTSNGGIVVAAAGNFGRDISQQPFFPASYGIRFEGHDPVLKNVFAITNIDETGRLNPESNYYPGMIAEIGTNTFSTLPNNSFNYMSGTSMAAPLFTHKIAKQFCDMKTQVLVKN